MPDFGASVDGVRGLLTNVTIARATRPNEAQVGEWIDQFTARVSARIDAAGGYTGLTTDQVGTVTQAARQLVELAAGSFAVDAAHPDRAAKADTRYGAVLWQRYVEGRDELLADLAAMHDQADSGAGGDEAPIGAFPPPMFTLDRGY